MYHKVSQSITEYYRLSQSITPYTLTTYNTQHTTYSSQHTTYNIQHITGYYRIISATINKAICSFEIIPQGFLLFSICKSPCHTHAHTHTHRHTQAHTYTHTRYIHCVCVSDYYRCNKYWFICFFVLVTSRNMREAKSRICRTGEGEVVVMMVDRDTSRLITPGKR